MKNPFTPNCYLALAVLSASLSAQAAETLIPGGAFDADASGWNWENWATPGSTVSFDSTLNSPRGAEGSGSLRLLANFVDNVEWQQAVFTKGLGTLDASVYRQISMDVKVDPTSTPRPQGDFGFIQAILRDGNNWDWRQAGFVTLNGTDWQRVRFAIPAEVTSTRALSLQLAQNEHVGPVIVNVDNIAWSDNFVVSSFDLGQTEGWRADWGTNPQLAHSALDAAGAVGSGSLQVSAPYFTPTPGWQQAVISRSFGANFDMSGYLSIELDVKIDPSSTIGGNGNYGYFEVKNPNGGAAIGAGVNLTSTEWTHLSFTIPPTLTSLSGLIIQLGSGSFAGPVTYNLDNVVLIPRVGEVPPPTLTFAKAQTGGMSIVATGTGQYDRHNVRSISSMADAISFVDNPLTMTYSFELLAHPANPPYANFQTHVFLVPGAAAFQNDSTPDWNAPTLLFLDLRAAANGAGGTATLRWKINVPGGNTGIYAPDRPTLTTTRLLGEWSLAISGGRNLLVTAPGGETLSFELPADLVAAFWTDEGSGDASLAYYLGVQPNVLDNRGQGIVVGSMAIKEGETTIARSVFTQGPLDETFWTIAGPAEAIQFNSEAGYNLSWTLPDTGFTDWQYATTLTNPEWTALSLPGTPVTVGGTRKQLFVPASALPATATGQFYMRMLRPQ